jgi:2'-5' RNA ligase
MSYKAMTTETVYIGDLPFEDYNQRQLSEISAERNRERAHHAKPAGNFVFSDHGWTPNEYEGFAVVSMVNENEGNEQLIERLTAIIDELKVNLQPTYAFYKLPVESFHQTVANTLSADRFKQHILHAGLEETYPSIIKCAFDNISAANDTRESGPLLMKMVGLSVFGTAIGMLGTFEKEADYNRITRFRAAFYDNEELAKLDVKMTRPFIGHITLAYIEHSLNKNQKDHLAEVINEINEGLKSEEIYFNLTHTGLKRYHHLAEFIRLDHYPSFKL